MLSRAEEAHRPPLTEREQALDTTREAVDYLRSRGLGRTEDHWKVLGILMALPVKSTRRVSVTRAAALLYCSRRALGRTCRKAGMPSPSRILAFARILNTLRVIRGSACSISRAAHATGWPDPFSFSNSVHRLTGLRPSEARAKGPLAFAEAWLQKELGDGTITLAAPEPPPCPSCGRLLELPALSSLQPSRS